MLMQIKHAKCLGHLGSKQNDLVCCLLIQIRLTQEWLAGIFVAKDRGTFLEMFVFF